MPTPIDRNTLPNTGLPDCIGEYLLRTPYGIMPPRILLLQQLLFRIVPRGRGAEGRQWHVAIRNSLWRSDRESSMWDVDNTPGTTRAPNGDFTAGLMWERQAIGTEAMFTSLRLNHGLVVAEIG